MNIIVCLKQVPKKDSILRIGPEQKWIDDFTRVYELAFSNLKKGGLIFSTSLQEKEKKVYGRLISNVSLTPLVDIIDDRSDDVFKASNERVVIYRR